MTYVDRDELRQSLLREISNKYILNRVLHILDSMPVPSCETCKRSAGDLGASRCLGTMLKEGSMCNQWEARP